MTILWILLAVIVLLIVWVVFSYNRLVDLRLRVKEGLSDIDVQLKRRYDLIPNLVETVKGYMTHEREVLENVTKARTEAMGTQTGTHDSVEKENMLSNTLKTLFAVAENYPDLKANANFLELQRELSDTENKIQAARRFYNSTVQELNEAVQSFPSNLIAGIFNFKEAEFFEVTTATEREPVKVQF
jgi:LemA protein